MLLGEAPPFHHSSCCSSVLPWYRWQCGCVLQGRGRLWLLGCIFCSNSWETPSHGTSLLRAVLPNHLLFPPSRSGGRIITLEGRGFELVQNVSMVVRGIGREQTVGVPAGCPSVAGAGLRAPA